MSVRRIETELDTVAGMQAGHMPVKTLAENFATVSQKE